MTEMQGCIKNMKDNLTEALFITTAVIMFCAGTTIMTSQALNVRKMASAEIHSMENHETVNLTREEPQFTLWE